MNQPPQTSPEDWQFDLPPEHIVWAQREVARHGEPILHVSHDPEDGNWMFYGNAQPTLTNLSGIRFGDLIATDPTLKELADLDIGWEAHRDTPQSPWTRRPRNPLNFRNTPED